METGHQRLPLPSLHPIIAADLERRADKAAAGFDSHGGLHEVTRAGILERLEPVTVEARLVLDLACTTGAAAASLEARFRGARILGVDRSQEMLAVAMGRRRWRSRSSYLRADPGALPLADNSVDVVHANLAFAASGEPRRLAGEVARVLRKDGLFVFAALGPDSLGALRRAWAQVDDGIHVQEFPDMHDLGDALVKSGFADPVLDVDRLAYTYSSSEALFRDLTAAGARNVLAGRHRGLTGTDRYRRLCAALDSGAKDGLIELEMEIIYGHCWGRAAQSGDGTVHIRPDAIQRRRQ